jgi:transcriptional regulator with PAS, ATPase and Fis domain
MRVGALHPIPIDVRIIAATNRDLRAEIDAGRFREDLYFRLNGVELTVPPLRERPNEIGPLCEAFIASASRARATAAPRLSTEAQQVLRAYAWPGNIRELRNAVERAVLLCGPGPIGHEHLPTDVTKARGNRAAEPAGVPLKADLEQMEKDRILAVLSACDGNQSKAAKQLGISRTTLWSRLNAWGLSKK